MYENDTYRITINWKNLIVKAILVILIIFLIGLIFPMPKLDTFYSKIFNENIATMSQTAKNYYEANKLPKNIGESSTITLEEMLNKNLLVEFKDKNNNTCSNTNSYAQITKTDTNEYVLKTQLSCKDDTEYILENIVTNTGCTTISCPNQVQDSIQNDDDDEDENTSINNIEDDEEDIISEGATYDKDGNLIGEIEYEFKKAVYSTAKDFFCEDGYTLNGTKCYKTIDTDKIAPTPLYFEDSVKVTQAKENVKDGYYVYSDYVKEIDKVESYCPEGYTPINGTCYKYEEATIIPGGTTYSCPTDYVLKGSTCVKTIDATKNTSSETDYYCPNGGNLNGTVCTYQAVYNLGTTTYTCPNGGTRNGSTCTYQATYHSGSTNCTCPKGGSLNGSTCYVTETYNATKYSYWSNPTITTSSTKLSEYNNGTQKRVLANSSCNLGKCTNTYYTYNLITGYNKCNDGSTPSNGVCKNSTTYAATCTTSSGTYTCDNGGTRNGSTCTYQATVSTTADYYSCPNGGTLNGTSCKYNATKTSTSSIYYSCPSGYSLNGTSCTKTINATKDTSETAYICKEGYTREGTTCYKTTSKESIITYKYSCKDGFTKSGDKENTICSKYISSQSTYYCENENEVLNGTTCVQTIKGALKGYSCPDNYMLIEDMCIRRENISIDAKYTTSTTTSYKYQWSKSKTLDGWTPTGKTRVVKSSINIK